MRKHLARHRQLLVFLVGGGLSALIDVGLMQGLILGGVNYVFATSAGFVVSLIFNYAFHARLTYASRLSGPSFGRYLSVVALNYCLTLGCVTVAVTTSGVAIWGKLLALPLVAAVSFVLGKHWIFKT